MCLRPLTIKNPKKFPTSSDFSFLQVPCGTCYECRKKRIDDWALRLRAEDSVSSSAYFITITYNNESVPISDNGFMTLSKSDLQNFHKRLRKFGKFKYFTCGEYGGRTHRPHYHGIYFNVKDADYFNLAWTLNGNSLGNIHFGTVTPRSIGYCLKYIHKKKFRKMFDRDDRVFEFSLKSQGLGKSFMTDKMFNFLSSNLDNFSVKKDGYSVGIPRYFKDKYFSSAQLEKIKYFQTHNYLLKSEKYKSWFYARYGENTPARMSYEDYTLYISWLRHLDDGDSDMIKDIF